MSLRCYITPTSRMKWHWLWIFPPLGGRGPGRGRDGRTVDWKDVGRRGTNAATGGGKDRSGQWLAINGSNLVFSLQVALFVTNNQSTDFLTAMSLPLDPIQHLSCNVKCLLLESVSFTFSFQIGIKYFTLYYHSLWVWIADTSASFTNINLTFDKERNTKVTALMNKLDSFWQIYIRIGLWSNDSYFIAGVVCGFSL